jgi:hypothetical protein
MASDENEARLRAEVAALRETVRELRDEVARLRAAQPVTTHPAYQPMWGQPATITSGISTPYVVCP